MCKLVRHRKTFLIKSTAVATILFLLVGSLSVYAYAGENVDDVHSSPEYKSVSGNGDGNSSDESDTDKSDSEKDKINFDSDGNSKIEESTTNKDKGDEADTSDSTKTEEKDAGSGNDVSGNDISGKDVSGNDLDDKKIEKSEIVNVVVPTSYTLALNPYGLSIKTGGNTLTTQQIVSGTYGIVNKSSTDQIVTVTLTIEDRNGDKIVFADSAEEAENAEEGVYAIYLEAVPAGEEQVLIDGKPVDKEVTGESLRKVEMTGANEQAVTLHGGANEISVKLDRAIYNDDNELVELAPDGKGVSAYTFSGVMNTNAEWEKLSSGIRLSVVYTYQTADGSEEIIEGTGAMIRIG